MKTKTKFHRKKPLLRERHEYKSIGYARQSSNKQISIGDQVEKLEKAGCVHVFQEIVSSSNKERPQFEAAIEMLEEGDELCLTKLDRGFRNQRQCINTLYDLQKRRIHVRTLDGLINTRALGNFASIIIGLISGLAEVERQMVIERTQESINHRREKGGNLGGRPKTNNEKEALVLRLRDEGCSYRSIRKQTGLALSTIRRIIVEQDVVIEI